MLGIVTMGIADDNKPQTDEIKLVEVTGRYSPNAIYTVSWSDGRISRYPFVWLVDNCRCSACYEPNCYQRLSLMKDLDPEVKPVTEEITDGGKFLKVTWPNGHVSEYPSSWLQHHVFDQRCYDPVADIQIRPWGSELANQIPRFHYDDVVQNDDVLFHWLYALHEVGLAVLTDAPTKKGCMDALGERVAFLRQTNYGTTFNVHTRKNVSSLAYTSAELGLHVDLPFYKFCPGVQMLHCIRQTKTAGGENQFSDAYHAALVLSRNHPEAYQILKTVKINFRNCGNDYLDNYHYMHSTPLIEEDSEGNFLRCNYNDQVRASYLNVPVEQVQNVYRAIKLLHQTLNEHNVCIKLKDGQIVSFNNSRVLHGRAGYVAETGSEMVRHLEGGYMDWDEIHSRMRVLREKRVGDLRA